MWQSLVGFCFVIFDIRPISQDSEIKPQGFLTNQSYQTTENVKVGCRLLNMSCSVVKTTVLSKAQRKRNICFIISVFKSLPDFRNARNTQEILGQFKNTLLLSVCFEAFVLFFLLPDFVFTIDESNQQIQNSVVVSQCGLSYIQTEPSTILSI